MKPFNLEEYLKNPSRTVVTRDGRSVKIHCTNYYANQTIIAEIEGLGVSYAFDIDGTFSYGNSPNDLFFASEKHEGWARICFSNSEYYLDNIIYPSKADAKNHADKFVNTVAAVKIEWEE